MIQTRFHYHSYTAVSSDFRNTVQLLAAQLDTTLPLLRITFFGAATNGDYEDKLLIIHEVLSSVYPSSRPLIGFVAQPVILPDGLTAEAIYLTPGESPDMASYKTIAETSYILIENKHEKALIMEGIRCMDMSENMACQGNEIFQRIATIFEKEDFRASDIVRQWNYIGHITEAENGMQHYQAFNEARARFYESSDWHERGYPAATGIGMSIQGLIISLIACIGTTPELRVIPIDNPLQVAAHHYSQSKLVGDEQRSLTKAVTTDFAGLQDTSILIPLATPKFERGKILLFQHSGLCYVSGTAAIRGEESMHSMNAELQTRQTIENINYLISEVNLTRIGISNFVTTFVSLRVYFKNAEDANTIQAEVEKQWAGIPVVYTQADICRKELLVEIEGVARLKL
ncbi:MAG: hypothetical protein RBT57_09820 [Paludibacter sp.]|jgi:enamine deaminase RidA (YjgF/YER057c/UK114 family)|nr:hypothetical protein [Paludibacter sp.]